MKIIDIIFAIVEGILKLTGKFLYFLFELAFPERKKEYKADFTPENKLLSTKNTGWAIGTKSLPLHFQGFFIAAATGIGKTTLFVITSLIRLAGTGSVICCDLAPELYKLTSAFYRALGYNIIVINFSDKSGEKSDGWNPFPRLKSDVANFFTTICTLSLGDSTRDPYWSLQSASILTVLATPLFKLDEKYRNVYTVLQLLNLLAAKPKIVNAFISKYADETLWTEYVAFHNNSPNTKASIISSAKAALTVFNQEGIQRITSQATFDLSAIRREKTIIYIQTNPAELEAYKLLISLFFNELISLALSHIAEDDENNIFLLIEEGGIFQIPILPIAITQGRKNRLSIALVAQSEKQLYHLYSHEEASTIISNCMSRLYLSNQPIDTAREISELSGKFEFRNKDNHLEKAPLLTVDEIRSLPPGKGILIHGHHPPALIKNITPYYKDPYMIEITSRAPVPLTRKLSLEMPPLFPINDLIKQKSNATN